MTATGLRSLLRLALVTGLLATLAACNTIAGIGDDVSGTARAVQRNL